MYPNNEDNGYFSELVTGVVGTVLGVIGIICFFIFYSGNDYEFILLFMGIFGLIVGGIALYFGINDRRSSR